MKRRDKERENISANIHSGGVKLLRRTKVPLRSQVECFSLVCSWADLLVQITIKCGGETKDLQRDGGGGGFNALAT